MFEEGAPGGQVAADGLLALIESLASRSGAIYPLKRLIEHLVGAGMARVKIPARAPSAMERLGKEYEHYLRCQRGLSDATIYACKRYFERLLTFRFDECLGDLEAITLSMLALAHLDAPLVRAVLRLWLRCQGRPLPDSTHLGRILTEVMPVRADANPLVAWPGCEIRRFRDDLFALSPLQPGPIGGVRIWDSGELTLSAPLGALERVPDSGSTPLQCLKVRFGVKGQPD